MDLSEECLEILNHGVFEVTDPGPLHTPINSFSLRRDENLKLILETEVPVTARSSAVDHAPGTVRMSTERVLLRNIGGLDAELFGVVPVGLKMRYTRGAEHPHREGAQVHIARTHNGAGAPAIYTIDWLENLPRSPFLWPAMSRVVTTSKSMRVISLDDGITIAQDSERQQMTWNAAKLTIADTTFYVCALEADDQAKRLKPGCIIFEGAPDDAFRKKVRTALALGLGVYLIDLGTTHYDGEWNVVSTLARSAYSPGGRAFDLGPNELAPLGSQFRHELNPARLTRLVGALTAAFDELDLANLSWAYWHACVATPHIAPAQFGAAIESLQNAYIKSRPGVVPDGWAPKSAWRALRGTMAAAIDGSDVSDDAKSALKAKLVSLNTVDQRTRLKAVMAALGMQLGADEERAWRRRNKAAHGAPIPEGEELAGIRDMKLLRGLLGRLLLRITGAAEEYIDYTSPRFPYRPIAEAPPDVALD